MSIFLMGVYDPKSKKWCTVTKCGSGFDDKTLDDLQDTFDMVKISKVSVNEELLAINAVLVLLLVLMFTIVNVFSPVKFEC